MGSVRAGRFGSVKLPFVLLSTPAERSSSDSAFRGDGTSFMGLVGMVGTA